MLPDADAVTSGSVGDGVVGEAGPDGGARDVALLRVTELTVIPVPQNVTNAAVQPR